MLFVAAAFFWRLGEERVASKHSVPPTALPPANATAPPVPTNIAGATNASAARNDRFKYRLQNSEATIGQLLKNPNAILLRNALIDTSSRTSLAIPAHLRSEGEPGSYIVQSRGVTTDAFRAQLKAAGASIVSYMPNNAYLVHLSSDGARQLREAGLVQSVLPYEPYYKLDPGLLRLAVEQKDLTDDTLLKVTLFSDEQAAGRQAVADLGAVTIGEDRSPFGPVLILRPKPDMLPALARLASVQEIETWRKRVPANDLTRVRIAVSTNSVVPDSYLQLTGTNVLVNVNDTGIQADHPDLTGRVTALLSADLSDSDGHGTHVAGILASSGANSPQVLIGTNMVVTTNSSGLVSTNFVLTNNIPGSVTNANFRGMAPQAKLFSMFALTDFGPSFLSDADLQENAARTNAFISNNSWNYFDDNSYNSAAASYDAAVRDALPDRSGSQPLLYVFAAGNSGFGGNEGQGGEPDSLRAPATAKNVISVGAVENFRPLEPTNEFAGYVDSSNQVASFSSRGNVAIGMEGEFGRFKPDVVAPGTFIVSTRSTNGPPSPYVIVSNMDNALTSGTNGVRWYRYDTGTSMSTPAVSGLLALMQEFFEQRLSRTNSPALMKALLINGARSLGSPYDSQVNNFINYQGWGLVNLTNSIPQQLLTNSESGWPLRFFDQSPTNSLTTGQTQTRYLQLSQDARSFPVRITLVWTDPPGNPAASVKLVNDLDLIVTNMDTGEIYAGNNIPAGSDFTITSGTNSTNVVVDSVNNVENVYLNSRIGQLGTNWAITIVARHVNVNAVTSQTNGIAQDYALVISTENPALPSPFTITDQPITNAPQYLLTVANNGIPLLTEHVGANSPLLTTTNGVTNQWHFYVFTNTGSYGTSNVLATNVAFATFLPPNLSRTRPSQEADIDLYVSTNSALTNLDASILAASFVSRQRGGTESVLFTDSTSNRVYYAAVKSEDQQASEYGFFAVATATPFSQRDKDGNLIINGLPVPIDVPDGTPASPGRALVFGFTAESDLIRRVIVTNGITHQLVGDLEGELLHDQKKVVLNNHTLNNGFPSGSFLFVYDDSDEGDIIGSKHSDGPGNLLDYMAEKAAGVWLLTMSDNAPNHTGRVDSLTLKIEPSTNNTGNFVTRTILANRFIYDFADVPPDAFEMDVDVGTTQGPVEVYLRHGDLPTRTIYDKTATFSPPGGTLKWNISDSPPLQPGIAFVGFFNPNAVPITINYRVRFQKRLGSPLLRNFSSGVTSQPVPDEAVTNLSVLVTNTEHIVEARVAVRIDHPRVSDLVLKLISPFGAEVLLAENRGYLTPDGFGAGGFTTNVFPRSDSGGFTGETNTIAVGSAPGTLLIDYDFFRIPDRMQVYYGNTSNTATLLYDTGIISGSASFSVVLDGSATNVYIAMNPGDNSNQGTAWQYVATVVSSTARYVVFTDNTNLTTVPIKFAAPPYNIPNYTGTNSAYTNDVFYMPEEPLAVLNGQSPSGVWQLQVLDARGGPTNVTHVIDWQLQLLLENPDVGAIGLTNGITYSNLITGAEIKFFFVDVPPLAGYATNSLVSFGGPLKLLFNQNGVPANGVPTDFTLLNGVLNATAILSTNGAAPPPPLVPGQRYYLAVENSAPSQTNAFNLTVTFDNILTNINVTALTNGVLLSTNIVATNALDYFQMDVSTNAISTAFEIVYPSDDVNLVLRKNVPLPNSTSFDYQSVNLGKTDELIVVTTNSSPVILSAGRWYLGVYNLTTNNVTYSVRATEEHPFAVTNALDLIPGTSTNATVKGGADITNFFRLTVTDTNTSDLLFSLYNLSGDVDLVVRKDALPTVGIFDYRSRHPSNSAEVVLVRTNATFPSLVGTWYVGVPNNLTSNVSFTIFTDVTTNGIPNGGPGTIYVTNILQDGIEFNSSAPPPILPPTNFFSFAVTNTNTVAVLFELYNFTNGNLDLRAGKEGGALNLASSSFGTNAEQIVIRLSQLGTNFFGNWILAVRNNDPFDVPFSIRATTSLTGLFANEPLPQFTVPPHLNSQGNYEFSFITAGNERYEIQTSSDLVNWTTIATITAGSGETTFDDPNPPAATYLFYRIRQLL